MDTNWPYLVKFWHVFFYSPFFFKESVISVSILESPGADDDKEAKQVGFSSHHRVVLAFVTLIFVTIFEISMENAFK